MLRLLFRGIGLITLAGAFAAVVLDGARTLADQRLEFTPLGMTLAALSPAKFATFPALAAKIHPKLWDPVLVSVMYIPTFFVLIVIGLLLIASTRKRGEPEAIGARR